MAACPFLCTPPGACCAGVAIARISTCRLQQLRHAAGRLGVLRAAAKQESFNSGAFRDSESQEIVPKISRKPFVNTPVLADGGGGGDNSGKASTRNLNQQAQQPPRRQQQPDVQQAEGAEDQEKPVKRRRGKRRPRQPATTQATDGVAAPDARQAAAEPQQQPQAAQAQGRSGPSAPAAHRLAAAGDVPTADWHALEQRSEAALEVVPAEDSSDAADSRQAAQRQQQSIQERLNQLYAGQLHGAAGAGGTSTVQQAQQPCWTVEAAEVLCQVGMDPKQATRVLRSAHMYAHRRSRQQAAENAAEADAAREPGPPPATAAGEEAVPALSGEQVEAVCRELTSTAKIPVARLRQVLAATPQLLACTPAELRKQHEVIASVWRRPRRLLMAILEHPRMLSPDFPAELGRSLQELSSLGFSKEQVSTAILAHPPITQLTMRDVVRHLGGAGLDLGNCTNEVLQFLARHSHLLGEQGAQLLGSKLALFATWRLPLPLCPLLLARCPALLKEADERMQGVVDILVGYGVTWRQLGEVVVGYPAVLRANPGVVRLTLKLLADFNIGLDRVAQYPRVFIHDPVNYIGPRLAYLKAYRPDKLRASLVSILSRGDDEFAVDFSGRLEEEYAVFKDAWVAQFHEQVNLPPGRSTLSRRMWAREITEDLWL